jgi:hypothetical protein
MNLPARGANPVGKGRRRIAADIIDNRAEDAIVVVEEWRWRWRR